MSMKNLFPFILIFVSGVFSKKLLSKNETNLVNVSVSVRPPFTYFNPNRGFAGVDIRILEIIADQLNFKLNLVKVDNFKPFSHRQLE